MTDQPAPPIQPTKPDSVPQRPLSAPKPAPSSGGARKGLQQIDPQLPGG